MAPKSSFSEDLKGEKRKKNNGLLLQLKQGSPELTMIDEVFKKEEGEVSKTAIAKMLIRRGFRSGKSTDPAAEPSPNQPITPSTNLESQGKDQGKKK